MNWTKIKTCLKTCLYFYDYKCNVINEVTPITGGNRLKIVPQRCVGHKPSITKYYIFNTLTVFIYYK